MFFYMYFLVKFTQTNKFIKTKHDLNIFTIKIKIAFIYDQYDLET